MLQTLLVKVIGKLERFYTLPKKVYEQGCRRTRADSTALVVKDDKGLAKYISEHGEVVQGSEASAIERLVITYQL